MDFNVKYHYLKDIEGFPLVSIKTKFFLKRYCPIF